MIHLCPFCGHKLTSGLTDGIAFCNICNSSLDSSQYNRILSAGWMLYRQKPETIDRIAKAVNLTEVESILVETFIMDNEFSIDEFRSALKEIGIKNDS